MFCGSCGYKRHVAQEGAAAVARLEDTLRSEVKRLEDKVRQLCDRSEARFKRSDERANGIEERSEKSDETLRSTLEQVRCDFTTRHDQIQSCVSDAQQKHHEDASAIQLLRMDETKTSQVMKRLQEDIRQESTARVALEATTRSVEETAERALRAAEQAKQVSQNFEGDIQERMETLEMKFSKNQMESLKQLSISDRIMYFQQAHQQAGAGMLKDMPALASGTGKNRPLFRAVQTTQM